GRVKGYPEGVIAHGWHLRRPAQAAVTCDPIDVNQFRGFLGDQQEATLGIELDLCRVGMRGTQWPGGAGDRVQCAFLVDTETGYVRRGWAGIGGVQDVEPPILIRQTDRTSSA